MVGGMPDGSCYTALGSIRPGQLMPLLPVSVSHDRALASECIIDTIVNRARRQRIIAPAGVSP